MKLRLLIAVFSLFFLNSCWFLMGERNYHLEPVGLSKEQFYWIAKFDDVTIQTQEVHGIGIPQSHGHEFTFTTGSSGITIESAELKTQAAIYLCDMYERDGQIYSRGPITLEAHSQPIVVGINWDVSKDRDAWELVEKSTTIIFHLRVANEHKDVSIKFESRKPKKISVPNDE